MVVLPRATISPMPGRTSIRHSYAAVVISILSEHIVGVLHRGFLLLSHCYFFGDSCSHMFFYNFFFIFFFIFLTLDYTHYSS